MSILIKEILNNKFEVTIKKVSTTKHVVTLSDKYYENLTRKKISKIKLLQYSFKFLLDREPNTSILSFFELDIISKYFPEFESEVRKIMKYKIEK